MELNDHALLMPSLLDGISPEQKEEAREAILAYLTVVQRIYDRVSRDPTYRDTLLTLTDDPSSSTLDGGRTPSSSKATNDA